MRFKTKLGTFGTEFSKRGLSRLEFTGRRSSTCAAPARRRGWSRALQSQLTAYGAGKRARWTVPLDLSAGTPFQQAVWRALRRIPYGKTRSYGWVARQIGRPRAARAVGAACGANPIPILIPCHRVIAGDGSLGGFSGGLVLKKRLLALEKNAKLPGTPKEC